MDVLNQAVLVLGALLPPLLDDKIGGGIEVISEILPQIPQDRLVDHIHPRVLFRIVLLPPLLEQIVLHLFKFFVDLNFELLLIGRLLFSSGVLVRPLIAKGIRTLNLLFFFFQIFVSLDFFDLKLRCNLKWVSALLGQ